jgi:hypothetical protein
MSGPLLPGALAALLLAAVGAPAQMLPKRPAGSSGTLVIPDQFLRSWDPVTIFFASDRGPASGGPEDRPDRFVGVEPDVSGEFRWLDARTLQFRPAEAWAPLRRYTWTVDARPFRLATLMPAPESTLPEDGAEGLEAVDEIALSFAQPLEASALPRMVSVELRPLPGVSSAASRWLTGDDFEIKAMERRSRSDPAQYVLGLRAPIPLGTHAVVHLRLSLEDDDPRSFEEIAFSTAQPFRVSSLGCRGRRYPISPEGSRYAREQALACESGDRELVVEFSAPPGELGPVEGRNLVRFTPAVEELELSVEGRTLQIAGDFAWDTLYEVALAPADLRDRSGRPLELRARSALFLYFPRQPAYLQWGASSGVAERHGPKQVPVEGRGEERVDLRIHAIDPLDRSLWPFPGGPVFVDESERPPGPGEEPPAHSDPELTVGIGDLAAHIATLGSPPVSTVIDLPLRRDGGAASFGIDIEPHLHRISGPQRPGTYLVGLRDLGGAGHRSWIRLQVTDLSLSALEEPTSVRFLVTSLATGLPVPGAEVTVEGSDRHGDDVEWTRFAEGTTAADGSFRWPATGFERHRRRQVRRIVVRKDDDVLVLDPNDAPDSFSDNQWSKSYETWLQWTQEPLDGRGPQPEMLCHVFTERPVYRPEEEVHVKGYLRRRAEGRLAPVPMQAWLVVEGPGELAWKYPVTVTESGSFYHRFHEPELPTGTYTAHLEDQKRQERWGHVSFQLEAYRIPRFEVRLLGPDDVPLDREFEVSLAARYYAGGSVAGQTVQWRVTQFPLTWTPKKLEGFHYSSDSRYSSGEPFRASPRLEREDQTDEEGAAKIALNPAVEPTAQPRQYVVEATVIGADDQTVTATKSVRALPPFVLGLKVPRYLERAREVVPELVAVGPDGEPIAGQPITVRLLRREWHSHLRASDFSDGVARYMTDVVDETVSETRVESAAGALPVPLALDRAGVYLVEIESRDRLDRAQVVRLDLYAGGDEPVTWAKPVSQVFALAQDQPRYAPGETASVVLKSPFQTARAFAILETPSGNRYEWLDVRSGAATYQVAVEGTWAPRIPVHFVLMRGRIPGTEPLPGSSTDLGKPTTLAATAWIDVEPVDNRVAVSLEHPQTALPGQTAEVTISLANPAGEPLPGEVTLWLVDQAVLSLGREQRLDPVPDFLTESGTHIAVRDTRNMAFGFLPLAEKPGGDVADEELGLLDRATVRQDFRSVPFFDPAIPVGPSGTVTVQVKLPDNLTNFKLRAKVASGPERFGFGTGQIAVRLPLIVQPALPRFVRPGDRFDAAAIGRVVEGPGGPGAVEIRAEGVRVAGAARREVDWVEGRPQRLAFPVEVGTPSYDPAGALSRREVTFRVAVERASDGATDAFEVKLPILPDRERVTRRSIEELSAGAPLTLEPVAEAVRDGTLRRSVLVSSEPALVRMAAGLDFLLDYPYGCTEQQISRARAYLALRRFRELLHQRGSEAALERAVKDTLVWIGSAIDDGGRVAYWPGSTGYVSLTAWVVEFLVEAREAGIAVDEALLERLLATLEQALRSDYGGFVDGEAYLERAWALSALARAGRFDAAYAAELSRRAEYLDLEGIAEVLLSFARAGESSATTERLAEQLWNGVVFRLHQGREVFGGLQWRRSDRSRLILPSETRAVAEMTRALARTQGDDPRVARLVDGLVTLGRGDGWGDTNANAAALLALSERLEPQPGAPLRQVEVQLGSRRETLSVGGEAPLASLVAAETGAGSLRIAVGEPLLARLETSYVAAGPGSEVAAESRGFVVTRELLRVGAEGEPPVRERLEAAGQIHALEVGDVLEEHVEVVNPAERHYVAVVVPLAAGVEPLNPRLATAPPEARPAGALSLAPSYTAYLDDRAAFYYDALPAGTYHFYFRTRAVTPGSFVQPPATAEMMYDAAVRGGSHGAVVRVAAVEEP